MKTILIIDDSLDMRMLLSATLKGTYHIIEASSGLDGIKKAFESQPELILLDLDMPEMSGYEVCDRLRADVQFKNIPIIILSSKKGPDAHSLAYKLGADNYLEKPFDKTELLTLIEARVKKNSILAQLSIGNLEVDLKALTVRVEGKNLELTPKEFKILTSLIERQGDIVERDILLSSVWQGKKVSGRVIDNHITALRKKLEVSNMVLESIYGSGYKLSSRS